jgi:hypothetical protein
MRNRNRLPNARTVPHALVGAAVLAALITVASPAAAQNCRRAGTDVTCDDGRVGQFIGDAIVWPDGTRSRAAPHPSVIIGNRPSVRVGPGVFVGEGKGSVPLDDPNSPNKRNCALLDGISYCY